MRETGGRRGVGGGEMGEGDRGEGRRGVGGGEIDEEDRGEE